MILSGKNHAYSNFTGTLLASALVQLTGTANIHTNPWSPVVHLLDDGHAWCDVTRVSQVIL